MATGVRGSVVDPDGTLGTIRAAGLNRLFLEFMNFLLVGGSFDNPPLD